MAAGKRERRRHGSDLGEEVDGLIRVHPSLLPALRGGAGGGLGGGWKAVICILMGVIALLLTDSLEIRVSKDSSNSKSMDGIIQWKKNATASDSDANKAAAAGGGTPADNPAEAPASEPAAGPNAAATVPANTPATEQAAVSNEACDDKDCWTYKSRAQPITHEERTKLRAEYGTWTWDDEPLRPKAAMREFYAKYEHRDFPWADLPANAWQKNSDYMTHYLNEGKALAMRAMEAILSEYGNGVKDGSGGTFEERAKMFQISMIPDADLSATNAMPGLDGGGWSTPRSWSGIKRRLLHSLVTEDSFVFAMGGHSAAAGHGNHFSQSYSLQVAWILEPIFARLGIKHESRNFGNGGLGTLQNGIAAGSLYGPDVDILMWDSGMTEKSGADIDIMARQGLLGGIKVPALWYFPPGILKPLAEHADVDVGYPGNAQIGLPSPNTLEELNNVAWAARYLKCGPDINAEHCGGNKYNGTCWIHREDWNPASQRPAPGGRAGWHPGNRYHQLIGRILAFTILKALHEVLDEWSQIPDFVLQDDAWHVTAYYAAMKKKVNEMPEGTVQCNGMNANGIGKFCSLPMKGRTEFTPRTRPDQTSLRAIMPQEQREFIDPPPPVAYQPPDVFNPLIYPPAGEVDVLNIVANGPPFRPVLRPQDGDFYDNTVTGLDTMTQKPGKGHVSIFPSGFCDGTLDSFCKRDAKFDCILYGHNDDRGGVLMDGKSGWMLFNIPKVENGFIVVKLETWHWKYEATKTKAWTSINNENDERRLMMEAEEREDQLWNGDEPDTHRRLGKPGPEPYCDDFLFEVSIDGTVQSFDRTQFTGATAENPNPLNTGIRKQAQRVVELVTLLDEPTFNGGAVKDVQVGLRMKGCKEFKVTHLYWS